MSQELTKWIDSVFKKRWLLHTLYWLTLVLIAALYGLGYGQEIIVSLILKSIYLPTQIVASYVFIYYQFPLLAKRKYIQFSISFIVLAYLFYVLTHFNFDLGMGSLLTSKHESHSVLSIFYDVEFFLRNIVDIYIIVFVTFAIKLIKDSFEMKGTKESLEAEKAQQEYNFLQARVQPNFLLQSLQVIESKASYEIEKVPELIAQLSEVLDYSLYESKQEAVILDNEVDKLHIVLQMSIKSYSWLDDLELIELFSRPSKIRHKPMLLISTFSSLLEDIRTRKLTGVTMKCSIGESSETIRLKVQIYPYKHDSQANLEKIDLTKTESTIKQLNDLNVVDQNLGIDHILIHINLKP